MMASRRSRLKAVANLPIRRKNVSLQQELENSKISKTEVGNANNTVCGAQEKGQDVKECEDAKSIENPESKQDTASDIPVEHGAENQNIEEVPSIITFTCKGNKSLPPLGSKFGRRVTPFVSLNSLKDKPQRELNGEFSKQNEKPNGDENQFVLEDCNSISLPENGNNKNLSVLQIGKDVPSITFHELPPLDTSLTESIPLNKSVENVPEVKATQEMNDTIQSQPLLSSGNGENKERTFDINFKLPVNNVKQNLFVNDICYSAKYSEDMFDKQKNVSPSHKNLSDYSLNHSASHSNSQVQYNSVGIKRNLTMFKQKKPKFNDFARKVADARREFQRKYEKIPPDRSSLRMIDLIFYNPSTNPMESKSKLERKDSHVGDEELLNESKVDDPEPGDKLSEFNPDDDLRSEDFGKMPVPQVKIGLNGEIILDEKSLIIETTDAKRGREDLQNSAPVFEDRSSKTCYYKRKTQKSRDWSDTETKRFYKALNTIGTDFSLMQKYFPFRTRLELKNKFKREEKLNRSLVDKALNNPSEFDITQFEKYLATEKQIQEETERRLQRKIRMKRGENKIRTKSSLLAREITEPDENAMEYETSENMDNGRMKLNEKSKQVNEINLLCEKYSLTGVEHSPGAQQSSPAIIFEGGNSGSVFSSSSRVFTSVSVNELNNVNKIRDAFDEIQNVNHADKDIPRSEILDSVNSVESINECGELRDNATGSVDVVDEFYQAVVNLSASLKSDEYKSMKSNRLGKRIRTSLSKNEKRKSIQSGHKNAKKSKDYPFMSTLDIETYESDCDNYSSSNESNDNSIISTKTITDQDFLKLLAANAKNMKESKIQFQITEGCSLEKNVEIILDNVPSIALSEI